MNDVGLLLDLWSSALTTAGVVALPMLAAALGVGLATSLIQAATQMQENVMSFVPKILAVGAVLAVSGHWMLSRLVQYCADSMQTTVEIARRSMQ